ncbi:hypothetical protein ACOMHN_064663 [Nucella lapillus]
MPTHNPLTIGLDTWVDDDRMHVEHVANTDQWNLIIQHVTSSDQGAYECQVQQVLGGDAAVQGTHGVHPLHDVQHAPLHQVETCSAAQDGRRLVLLAMVDASF